MAKGRQVYLGSEKGLPAVLWRGAMLTLLRYVWVRHYGVGYCIGGAMGDAEN